MEGQFFGDLSVIGMKGCDDFVEQVDRYLRESRDADESYIVDADCPRFGTGESKGIVHTSLRGHDIYLICDAFNYGVTYNMYGMQVPMSPDDHFQDLKRTIRGYWRKSAKDLCDHADAVRGPTAQTLRA